MTVVKNNQGSGYFTPCVIVLVIAMILSVVLFYASTMTIVQTTRENTEMVLDSFVMKNSIEIYDSIKQGHDFTEKFDKNFYFLNIPADSRWTFQITVCTILVKMAKRSTLLLIRRSLIK